MTHAPTLKQLRYLRALAEERHFGHAAARCHISQSTLSTGIQELERMLDATLIERNNKQVMLTPLGEEVLQRGCQILGLVDDLMAACDRSSKPFQQQLRLGVIPTIAPFLLPKLLQSLRREHPDFRLYIRENLSEPLIAELARGELDLLLLALPYPAEGVTTEFLFHDPFTLALPKGHNFCDQQAVSTSQLKGQDLLLLEDGHCLREHVLEACQLRESDFNLPYKATSLNTIVQMVANGIGMTLLPQMAQASGILTGTDIATRPFEEACVWRSIGLMWRQSSPRAEEFKILGEFIRTITNSEPATENL
ncbi:hydrogen peroxide-inducible genes activator [Porticoccaceae bacterium LTM1]|nr:hydrogen peroxide-inducible genes activator [Porticoccaceae bacterium LTM1]